MSDPAQTLSLTALHALHRSLGARLVPFAGYDMPVQFPAGILAEHLHTRAKASLFDVSHMGQIRLSGPDAAAALESLVPADIIGLPVGRQRYTFFTNDAGGILDDLIVANAGDALLIVVNASRKAEDLAWLQSSIGTRCRIDPMFERALLALQGPAASRVMAAFAPISPAMKFMQFARFAFDGIEFSLTRSGYTGEDGFEIGLPAVDAERFARRLLADSEVLPAGLGARDSLRLEAGLCLYGHDIDGETTPVEAALEWAIPKIRREGGARAGGFPGAPIILRQIEGGTTRRRVGLIPEGRAPIREGEVLFNADRVAIGRVTSGGFGATVNGPIAMALVDAGFTAPGTLLTAVVRERPRECRVVRLPFVPQRYHR
ncbi:MAG: glycine cleavage system aminomethyltransferase GcvT [Burkholderiales bacterium]